MACDECKSDLECPIEDDMSSISEALQKAHGIIIATPVYFGNMSAQAKALIDRTLPMRRNGMRLKDKVIGCIAIGASRNGGQELVVQSLHNAFLIHECIIVSDTKTAHFGGIAVSGRNQDAVLADKSGLQTIKNLASQVMSVASKMNSLIT